MKRAKEGKETVVIMKMTTLCYIEKDGRYLMLHRTKKEKDINKGKWIGVGGHAEDGESPEDCLLRDRELRVVIAVAPHHVDLTVKQVMYQLFISLNISEMYQHVHVANYIVYLF